MQHDDSGSGAGWDRTRSWTGAEPDSLDRRPLVAGRYRDLGALQTGPDRAAVRHFFDLHLKRGVVGKRVPASAGGLPVEAAVLADLCHPGILPLLDALPEEDGEHWLLLFPSLPGPTLDAVLRDGALPAARAVAVVVGAAAALAAAHRAGVVHRDVTPSNLLVHDGDAVTVIDWGLALRSGAGGQEGPAVCGTPPWMAPEQAGGEAGRVGPTADVYALAAVLWTALDGVGPYEGASGPAATTRIRAGAPIPLARSGGDIDPGLLEIIEEAMARDPERRPADAGAFLARLRAWRAEG